MKKLYRVSFAQADRNAKIACIKIVRRLSDMGLKEAKDLVEETMDLDSINTHSEVELREADNREDNFIPNVSIKDLRDLGTTVEAMVPGYASSRKAAISSLREALKYAVAAEDDDMALGIVGVLKAYK